MPLTKEDFATNSTHKVHVRLATGLAPVLMTQTVQEINAIAGDIQGVSAEVARKLIDNNAATQPTIDQLVAMSGGPAAPPDPAPPAQADADQKGSAKK